MPPQIPVLIVQALLTYGPDVAKGVKALLTKGEVTDADFDALFAKIDALDFDDSRNAARKLVAGNAA